MRTTNKRKLNRLIRECFEEGCGEIEPAAMALLTMKEIIELIMITVAAFKSDDFVPVISESQKEKGKGRRYHQPQRAINHKSKYI